SRLEGLSLRDIANLSPPRFGSCPFGASGLKSRIPVLTSLERPTGVRVGRRQHGAEDGVATMTPTGLGESNTARNESLEIFAVVRAGYDTTKSRILCGSMRLPLKFLLTVACLTAVVSNPDDDRTTGRNGSNKALMLGASFSQQSQVIAELARYYCVTQIGLNLSPELSDRSIYPYYTRIQITYNIYVKPLGVNFGKANWRQISWPRNISYSKRMYFTDATAALTSLLLNHNGSCSDSERAVAMEGSMVLDNDPEDSGSEAPCWTDGSNVKMSRCHDIKMSRCQDVTMSRCHDVKMSRCQRCPMSKMSDVKMSRCQDVDVDVTMSRCHDVRDVTMSEMSRCQRCQMSMMSRCQDVTMSRCHMSRCHDVRDVTMSRDVDRCQMSHDVPMSRCPDVKIYRDISDCRDISEASSSEGRPHNFRQETNLRGLPQPVRQLDRKPQQYGLNGFDTRFDAVTAAALAINAPWSRRENYTAEPADLDCSSFKEKIFEERSQPGLSWTFVSRVPISPSPETHQRISHPVPRRRLGSSRLSRILSKLVHASIVSAVVSGGLSAAAACLTLAAMAVNLWFRKVPYIRLSSPIVNTIIGLGCLLCHASCLIMTFNAYMGSQLGLCCVPAALPHHWLLVRLSTIKDWHLCMVIAAILLMDAGLLLALRLLDSPALAVKRLSE
uniref:G_PROTEIN_RECEP_F3_4 domain-containing protein n=1 Tax=Macrostomum lignano TaxID=282301 RepID=A0A1I8FPH6_9PLAT